MRRRRENRGKEECRGICLKERYRFRGCMGTGKGGGSLLPFFPMNFNAQSRSPGHCGPYVLETVISKPHIRVMLQDVWYMMFGVCVCGKRKKEYFTALNSQKFNKQWSKSVFFRSGERSFPRNLNKRHFYPLQCLALFIPQTSLASNKLDQWSTPVIHFHMQPTQYCTNADMSILKRRTEKTNMLLASLLGKYAFSIQSCQWGEYLKRLCITNPSWVTTINKEKSF